MKSKLHHFKRPKLHINSLDSSQKVIFTGFNFNFKFINPKFFFIIFLVKRITLFTKEYFYSIQHNYCIYFSTNLIDILPLPVC